MPDLTIITATWKRPKLLALCLEQVLAQEVGSMRFEHIVVSDGPSHEAKAIARFYKVRYLERKKTGGCCGASAKDVGITEAAGEYICFWDDDNIYEPHALATLYSAAYGCDIGIVQTYHRVLSEDGREPIFRKIPCPWPGHFERGNVDTMCICIRRKFAIKEKWAIAEERATDFLWLKKLEAHSPVVRFVPVTIGKHL